MAAVLTKDLIYEILSVVEEIPEGKVASYGQIAGLIGREKNARLVGKVLGMAEYYGKYPCHRVVDCLGGTKAAFDLYAPGTQRALLEAEGAVFRPDGTVDLARCQWDPLEG